MNKEFLFQQDLQKGEEIIEDIADTLHQSIPGLIGMSIFTPSPFHKDKIFMLNIATNIQKSESRHQADKFVYRRLLDKENSIAAEAIAGKIKSGFSKLFPKEHFCIHFRMPLKNGKYTVLQAVFDISVETKAKEIEKNFDRICEESNLQEFFSSFLPQIDALNADYLSLKPPYQENALIAVCDLSRFVKKSEDIGFTQANDFARKFTTEYLIDILKKYKCEISQHTGDGIWFHIKFDPNDEMAKKDAVESGQKISREIIDGFKSFAAQKNFKLEDMKLRIAFDLGEIVSLSEDIPQPTSSTLTELAQYLRQADRSRHVIIVGKNIRQTETQVHKVSKRFPYN